MKKDFFSGIVIRNNLVAATIYFWEDFKTIFNTDDIEVYKDYLLQRDHFLKDLAYTPVRIIDVPFDLKRFEQSQKRTHNEWAWEVANTPEQLDMLLAKYPFIPEAPKKEGIACATLMAVLPVTFDKESFNLANNPIPVEQLNLLISKIETYFQLPQLKYLSNHRCKGAGFSVGDRFISFSLVEELDNYIINRIFRENKADKILSLPDDFGRFSFKNKNYFKKIEEAYFTVIILPIAVFGASLEIDYCSAVLTKKEGEMSKNISFEIKRMAEEKSITVINDLVKFYPPSFVPVYWEEVLKDISEVLGIKGTSIKRVK